MGLSLVHNCQFHKQHLSGMLFPRAVTKQQLLIKAQCGCYTLHANDFGKKEGGKQQTNFETLLVWKLQSAPVTDTVATP